MFCSSTPDDALLFRLLVQPRRPLVGDQLVLEAVLLRQAWNEGLELWREEVAGLGFRV